mgnify:FL=1
MSNEHQEFEEGDSPNAYEALIDSAYDSVDIYGEPEDFIRQFAALSPEVGHLFAAHWCQSEVCNGGFHQFFMNSTGILAPEAVLGFRALGLEDWAQLLESAMTIIGAPYPRQREARRAAVQMPVRSGQAREEWNPFCKLDDRFYASFETNPLRWEAAANAYAEAAA